jgi:hypothetical protein
MNCQVCKVLILFLITFNSLNSARGFVNQAKNTVDVFGESYDHDYDQDYDDKEDFEEIELHEKSEENINVDQGNLLTGIDKKTVKERA